jgi:hypothetical protein
MSLACYYNIVRPYALQVPFVNIFTNIFTKSQSVTSDTHNAANILDHLPIQL